MFESNFNDGIKHPGTLHIGGSNRSLLFDEVDVFPRIGIIRGPEFGALWTPFFAGATWHFNFKRKAFARC
jgi:hypothetical protein